jgi:hypothetical protein
VIRLGTLVTLVDGRDFKAFLRRDLFLLVVAGGVAHLFGEREIALVVDQLVLGAGNGTEDFLQDQRGVPD